MPDSMNMSEEEKAQYRQKLLAQQKAQRAARQKAAQAETAPDEPRPQRRQAAQPVDDVSRTGEPVPKTARRKPQVPGAPTPSGNRKPRPQTPGPQVPGNQPRREAPPERKQRTAEMQSPCPATPPQDPFAPPPERQQHVHSLLDDVADMPNYAAKAYEQSQRLTKRLSGGMKTFYVILGALFGFIAFAVAFFTSKSDDKDKEYLRTVIKYALIGNVIQWIFLIITSIAGIGALFYSIAQIAR